MRKNLNFAVGALAFALIGGIVGCSGSSTEKPTPEAGTKDSQTTASGNLAIDGSSTVFPILNVMAEDFQADNTGAKVTVSKSGTGSGLQKFERGEIDIAAASRPIKDSEVAALAKAKIEFIEVPIAYDGVCVIVNPASKIDKVTPEQLNAAWQTDSKVKTYADLNPAWGTDKLSFYGPTENHGTYEYFTEAINKKKGNIRKDYQANQEYNVVVSSVAGDKGGMGYVGYNYYSNAKGKVKIVPVDAGKGPITPSEQTITDGTYTPLSRPLFIYVNKAKYDSSPVVKAFVDFALGAKGIAAIKEASYVALPDTALTAVKDRVKAEKVGSIFMGVKPGLTIEQVMAKETGK